MTRFMGRISRIGNTSRRRAPATAVWLVTTLSAPTPIRLLAFNQTTDDAAQWGCCTIANNPAPQQFVPEIAAPARVVQPLFTCGRRLGAHVSIGTAKRGKAAQYSERTCDTRHESRPAWKRVLGAKWSGGSACSSSSGRPHRDAGLPVHDLYRPGVRSSGEDSIGGLTGHFNGHPVQGLISRWTAGAKVERVVAGKRDRFD